MIPGLGLSLRLLRLLGIGPSVIRVGSVPHALRRLGRVGVLLLRLLDNGARSAGLGVVLLVPVVPEWVHVAPTIEVRDKATVAGRALATEETVLANGSRARGGFSALALPFLRSL